MGKGEEDQVGIICAGKDGAWTRGMSVEGRVTKDIMGPEPASLADRWDEAMRERGASRMTP